MVDQAEIDEKIAEERRNTRKKQRELHTDFHAVKPQIGDVESGKFQHMRSRLNDIFSNVHHPREQQNDALTFKELSWAAKEQSSNMADSAHRFDFTALASKISNKFTRDGEFSWAALGEDLGHINTGVPSFTSMLGPIGKEVKVRKVESRKEKEVLGVTERPEEINQVEDEADEATNMRLKKLLEMILQHTEHEQEGETTPFDLLHLLIDPADPVQTIENFFDYSFLIKDKLVLQDMSVETGLPVAIGVAQKRIIESDFSIEKSQMILSISMQELEEFAKLLYPNRRVLSTSSSSSSCSVENSTRDGRGGESHPLHRCDPLYDASDASEQADIILQQSQKRSEDRRNSQSHSTVGASSRSSSAAVKSGSTSKHQSQSAVATSRRPLVVTSSSSTSSGSRQLVTSIVGAQRASNSDNKKHHLESLENEDDDDNEGRRQQQHSPATTSSTNSGGKQQENTTPPNRNVTRMPAGLTVGNSNGGGGHKRLRTEQSGGNNQQNEGEIL